VKEKYFKTKYRPIGTLFKRFRYIFEILRTCQKIRGQISAQSELQLQALQTCNIYIYIYIYLTESVAVRILKDNKMDYFTK
jgi:hypothetical protein